MKEIINTLFQIIGLAVCVFGIPYLVRLGWGMAENRTKKVCDICWRDIKKVNEKLNS